MGMLREGGDFPDSGGGLERPVAAPTLPFLKICAARTPLTYIGAQNRPADGHLRSSGSPLENARALEYRISVSEIIEL